MTDGPSMGLSDGVSRARRFGRRCTRNERGASLVEFALVSPFLFLLLAGIIDFSTTFNNLQALRSGVREGARQGAVLNFGSTNSCNLTGLSGGTTTDIQHLMCYTKQQTGMGSQNVRVKIMFADAGLTTEQSTGWTAGTSLVVCAQAPESSLTGALAPYFNGKFMRSKTAIRFEQMSNVSEHSGYETPMTGSDWSWCSSPSQVSP